MNRIHKIAIAGALTGAAVWLGGCTQAQIDTANRNFMATVCANGQTLLTQIPTGLLTPAQIADAGNLACSTVFGTTAAPAPAPGSAPVFPAPTPSPTPTAPASKAL